MRILAFDPGTHRTGWAMVDVRGGRARNLPITTTFQEAGNIDSTPDAIDTLIRTEPCDVLAIEKLEGQVFLGKTGAQAIVPHLLASSNVAGILRGVAHVRGRRVIEMGAKVWRKLVCGNGQATDEAIKEAVSRLVYGLPKRTNVHVRDAVGLGLGAGWHLGGEVDGGA